MKIIALCLCLIYSTAAFSSETKLLAAFEPSKEEITGNIQPLISVVDAQLSALNKGDIDKAYNDFTSSKFRSTTSLDKYKQLITTYITKNMKFQLHSTYFEDGIASLQGNLVSTDGDSLSVEYDLIQEGGQWKIYGFQLINPEVQAPRSEDIHL